MAENVSDNVKFDVEEVKSAMDALETCFTNFADTLKTVNDYMETMINAGVDSAIFGDYGSKLFQIWSANASTFGDFHANFEAWAEVVAVISAEKADFVVDTTALYRDNGSTLDGVQGAREFIKENGRLGEYTGDDEAIQAVLGHASTTPFGGGQASSSAINEFGGVNEIDDATGRILLKDADGNITAQYDPATGVYYDATGAVIGDENAYKEWLRSHGYPEEVISAITKPTVPSSEGTPDTLTFQIGDQELTGNVVPDETFDGTKVQTEDGTIYYLDKDGNVLAYFDADGYHKPDGTVMTDEEKDAFVEEHTPSQQEPAGATDSDTVTFNHGDEEITGKRIEDESYDGIEVETDDKIYYLDKDGNVLAYKDKETGYFHGPDGTTMSNEGANDFLAQHGGDGGESSPEEPAVEEPDVETTSFTHNGEELSGTVVEDETYDGTAVQTEDETIYYLDKDGNVIAYKDPNTGYLHEPDGTTMSAEDAENFRLLHDGDPSNDPELPPEEIEYSEPDLRTGSQDGGEYVSRNNEYSGGTYKYSDENGNLIYRYTDERGNVVGYKVYRPDEVDNGIIIGDGTWYDANGTQGSKPTNAEWNAQTEPQVPTTFTDGTAGSQVSIPNHDVEGPFGSYLAAPDTWDEIVTAMNNRQPIVLQPGKTFLYDGPGNSEVHIATRDGNAYLIYHNGSYYQSDASGNIINDTPIDIARYTSGDHDYVYGTPSNDSYYGKPFVGDN